MLCIRSAVLPASTARLMASCTVAQWMRSPIVVLPWSSQLVIIKSAAGFSTSFSTAGVLSSSAACSTTAGSDCVSETAAVSGVAVSAKADVHKPKAMAAASKSAGKRFVFLFIWYPLFSPGRNVQDISILYKYTPPPLILASGKGHIFIFIGKFRRFIHLGRVFFDGIVIAESTRAGHARPLQRR